MPSPARTRTLPVGLVIREASHDDIDHARELVRAYARSLPFDLDFQNFEEELRAFPGEYVPPAGRLLIAAVGEERVGCVALRPLGEGVCEMKRLFVSPACRSRGAGRSLAQRIITEAVAAGYRRMRLDTVPGMSHAIALYRSLGFREIPPYCVNPIPGALFLELAVHPIGGDRKTDESATASPRRPGDG